MPTPERPSPIYAQIADHFRNAILNGELKPGKRLPPVTEIAAEWGVAAGTAAKAIAQLQVEGAIYTSPQGSFVSNDEVIRRPPGDMIQSARRIKTNGDSVEVTAAEIVTAPNYVADLLGIPIGAQVVRREEITHSKGHPRVLSVDWVPGFNVTIGERLTEKAPITGGVLAAVESLTSRRVAHGRDHLRARAADAREAGALRIPVGTPILAGAHVWTDNDGTVIYGEWVMPPDQVVSYPYLRSDSEGEEH